MKRFLIPGMVLVLAADSDAANEAASDFACKIDRAATDAGINARLYLCEASDTTQLPPAGESPDTLAGLTCDYREVLRLRAALKHIADGSYDLLTDAEAYARRESRA